MLGVQNLSPFDGDRNTENILIPTSDAVHTEQIHLWAAGSCYKIPLSCQPVGAQVVHSLGSAAVLQDSW